MCSITAWGDDLVDIESDTPPCWLGGDGEMAQAIRRHSWCQTDMGPLAGWPRSLQSVLRLILTAPEPMALWWGPNCRQVWNDGFADHLAAAGVAMDLGSRAAEAWSTCWPMFQQALDRAADAWAPQPALTLPPSFSRALTQVTIRPVEDDLGQIAGFVIRLQPMDRNGLSSDDPVTLPIDRRIDDRSALTLLHDLHLRLREAKDVNEAMSEVLYLATSFADTDRGGVHLVDADDRWISLVALHGFADESDYTRTYCEHDLRIPSPVLDRLRTKRQRVVLTDVARSNLPEVVRTMMQDAGVAAMVSIPLIGPERHFLGVLTVHFREARSLDSFTLRLLDLLGWMAGEFVHIRQVLQRIENQHRDDQRLRRLSQQWRGMADPLAIQQHTIRKLVKWLDVERCGFIYFNADKETLEVEAIDPDRPSEARRLAIPASHCPDQLLDPIRKGQTIALDDCGTDPARDYLGSIGIGALCAVPLLSRDRVVGCLFIGTGSKRHWSCAEVKFLEEVGERCKLAVARARAEATLQETSDRFRRTTELLPSLLWHADSDGINFVDNRQWERLTGQSYSDGQNGGWIRSVHPEDRPMELDIVKRADDFHTPIERQVRYRMRDGSYRWFLARSVPARDKNGQVTGWYGSAIDIHELRTLKDRQGFLLAELQHRVRNLLTVTRSVFERTIDSGYDIDDINDHFRGRLDALARTHAGISHHPEQLVDLQNLVREELLSVGVSDGPSVRIEGPDVGMPLDIAENLALTFHELTVNAIKFGALKVKSGKLAITWQVDADHRGGKKLLLSWTESGIPAIDLRPSRYGFGRELIEEALPYRLRADTELLFERGGVRCTIAVPLSPVDDDAVRYGEGGWS